MFLFGAQKINAMPEEVSPDLFDEVLTLADCGGDYETYMDRLHEIFDRDFLRSVPYLNGLPVRVSRALAEDGRRKIFYHLTDKLDQTVGERLPDLPRMERMPISRRMIDHAHCPPLLYFEHIHKGKLRTNIYHPSKRFQVVLEKQNGYYLLITTFVVDSDHRHERVKRNHREYLEKIEGAAQ